MRVPLVYTAAFAMLVQQSLTTMSGLTILVLAPPIAAETGLAQASLIYTVFLYGGSMISALVGGGFLLRFGALRISQICPRGSNRPTLNTPGLTLLFVIGAVITGIGGGPSTPASSQILARYADPASAPFYIFNQTNWRAGGWCHSRSVTASIRVTFWLAWCFGLCCADGYYSCAFTSTSPR